MEANLVLLHRTVADTPRWYGLAQVANDETVTLARFWGTGPLGYAKLLIDRNEERTIASYRRELLWEKQAKGYRPVGAIRFEPDSAMCEALESVGRRWASRVVAREIFAHFGALLDVDPETYRPAQRDAIEVDPTLINPFDEGPYGLVYLRSLTAAAAAYVRRDRSVGRWRNERSEAWILRLPWADIARVDTLSSTRTGIGDDRDDSDDVLATADRIYRPASAGPYRWFRAALHDARNVYA